MVKACFRKLSLRLEAVSYTHLDVYKRQEQCVALLPTYTQQVIDAREELTNWHKDMIKYLNIETEEKRIKRFGLDRALYTIPSLFKDEFKYKSMAENTVKLIEEQSVTIGEIYDYDTSTLYTCLLYTSRCV